jgi:hypothetical protein
VFRKSWPFFRVLILTKGPFQLLSRLAPPRLPAQDEARRRWGSAALSALAFMSPVPGLAWLTAVSVLEPVAIAFSHCCVVSCGFTSKRILRVSSGDRAEAAFAGRLALP